MLKLTIEETMDLKAWEGAIRQRATTLPSAAVTRVANACLQQLTAILRIHDELSGSSTTTTFQRALDALWSPGESEPHQLQPALAEMQCLHHALMHTPPPGSTASRFLFCVESIAAASVELMSKASSGAAPDLAAWLSSLYWALQQVTHPFIEKEVMTSRDFDEKMRHPIQLILRQATAHYLNQFGQLSAEEAIISAVRRDAASIDTALEEQLRAIHSLRARTVPN